MLDDGFNHVLRSTHVGPIIKAIEDGDVEELCKVPDSETAIARPWRGSALPDFLEYVGRIRFRYERCAMTVVPCSFL